MVEELGEVLGNPKKNDRSLSILTQESHLQPEAGDGKQPRPDL